MTAIITVVIGLQDFALQLVVLLKVNKLEPESACIMVDVKPLKFGCKPMAMSHQLLKKIVSITSIPDECEHHASLGTGNSDYTGLYVGIGMAVALIVILCILLLMVRCRRQKLTNFSYFQRPLYISGQDPSKMSGFISPHFPTVPF